MDNLLEKPKRKENLFGLPSYSFLEELLNSISHGVGIAFSIFAFIFLFLKFSYDFKSVACISLYTFTLLILYMGSTLYHGVKISKFKSYLRKFDHCSIFLLIAGTYTPICVLCIGSFGSLIVLALVWIIALIGIILNLIDVNKFSKVSMVCYIFMGWSVLFIAGAVMNSLNKTQLIWLLVGGVFYTLGAVLYVVGKKVKYIHFVWHLFVLVGSISHFMILV